MLYVFLVGFSPLLIAVLFEWRLRGGAFLEAYAAMVLKYQSPSIAVILYWILATLFLVWFTYFSRSPRVKDHDKFAVFLMLCGAVVGWMLTAVRVLLRR
jgi:hypothetical protein